MQNCDVQFMLKACFEKLYPGKTLVFSSAVPAQEENIFALFTVLYTSSNRGDFFLSQNDAFSFAQYLMRLDKSFYYFLRIGHFGGVDNFQLLRYVNDAWELCSSISHRQILTQGDDLSASAKQQLFSAKEWGTSYCLSVKCCTKENLHKLMRYLAIFRTSSGLPKDRAQQAMRRVLVSDDSIYGYIYWEDQTKQEIGQELRQLLNQMKELINAPPYSSSRPRLMLALNRAIDAFLEFQDFPTQKVLIYCLNHIKFQTEHGLLKQLIYRVLLLLGVSAQRLNHSCLFKSPILELKNVIQLQLPKRFVV